MGKYIVIGFLFLTGCTQFLASVSGTFVGKIASDKAIKEMDKKVDK